MLILRQNPKLHLLSLAVAGFLISDPLSAVAQNLRPPAAPIRLGGKASNAKSPIAQVKAIVVNGDKQEAATTEDIELIRAEAGAPVNLVIGHGLFEGDVIKTKTDDQVTLKFANAPDGTEQLIYLDENTEVVIGSLCLRSGWLLAQVGLGFKICVGNTTLGVKTTEFEVASTVAEPLKVSVFKGKVGLKPTQETERVTRAKEESSSLASSQTDLTTAGLEVVGKKQLTVKPSPSGPVVEETDLSSEEGKARIDFWSRKIMKASQPVKSEKANLNFNDTDRSTEFINARFKALWRGEATAYISLGEIYNDWDMGEKARENLLKAVQAKPALATAPNFQANLGEAYRLSGNYGLAQVYLKAALEAKPDYPFAYYSLGTTLVQSYDKQPDNKALLDEARQFYLRSLQEGSFGPAVNKNLAEQEIDNVIEKRGKLFLVGQKEWISSEKWWCEKEKPEGVTYTGRLNLPELEAIGLKVSGPATFFIVGDQFKIKAGSQILTGNIVGTTTENYTAVNLRFDDPRISRISQESIGLSFRQTGQCERLTFRSSSATSGAVIMAAKQ